MVAVHDPVQGADAGEPGAIRLAGPGQHVRSGGGGDGGRKSDAKIHATEPRTEMMSRVHLDSRRHPDRDRAGHLRRRRVRRHRGRPDRHRAGRGQPDRARQPRRGAGAAATSRGCGPASCGPGSTPPWSPTAVRSWCSTGSAASVRPWRPRRWRWASSGPARRAAAWWRCATPGTSAGSAATPRPRSPPACSPSTS